MVQDGPVNENIQTGNDVDLLAFPAPKWHKHEGNRYIGTSCLIIQKDTTTDWVNIGVYRVAVHDKKTAGLYISPGKHGRLIMEKYWARGEGCPVAVLEIPHGVSEFEVAGGLKGEPIEVIESQITGLPIPATAEIVIEGKVPPGELRDEGPFGEWLGYYAAGMRPAPYHQDRGHPPPQ